MGKIYYQLMCVFVLLSAAIVVVVVTEIRSVVAQTQAVVRRTDQVDVGARQSFRSVHCTMLFAIDRSVSSRFQVQLEAYRDRQHKRKLDGY